jgi:RND family efflux transporter MFP subunit
VTPDNVVVVDSSRISAGPLLTGTLQPERMAQIRAELSGAMVSVATERGQRVGRGETLGRIDDATMQDNFISARSGVTTAEQAAAVARRNVERSEALLHAGAISESALEDARLQFQTAESQLADARARLVQAQTQLDKTTVRAPFAGIVSDRQINAGDIVQPGSALFTVVDPSSMRLEGAVPASELERVRVGANVEFTAAGYADRTFTGKVVRVNPTTDPATGQIPVIASIPNSGGDLVGGLYAEGLVATESRVGLIVPLSAVEIAQERAEVLRLRQGKSSVWPLRPVCAMNARSASKSQPASHAATRCSWARRGPYLQARA